MKYSTINQSVFFHSSPHDVYEALMDEKKHAEFTDSPVKVSRSVGGTFSVWGGDLRGTNVSLTPDKKIVQKWRSSDWPEGHYSTVTFIFTKTKDGTKLEFTQTGVPEEFYKDISSGWHTYYWEPMKEMLEK